MCGVVGFITNNKKEDFNHQNLVNMCNTLSHRGPDNDGFMAYLDKIYLAHRRLSILDLGRGGAQPMLSNSERFIISFNGEIYNHLNLRLFLQKYKKIIWKSSSDTETLVELFDYFGA